jgi:K+-transporting ATPase A subunit
MRYSASIISFSTFCFIFVYAIQRLQGLLPFNPQQMYRTIATIDPAR